MQDGRQGLTFNSGHDNSQHRGISSGGDAEKC